jgi:hypothetical protein
MSATRTLSRPGVAVLAPVLLALMAGPAPALAASPTGACTDQEGVTVVVDSTDVGGDIVVGCAPTDPASGRDALEAAGFTVTESQPGFFCAIDERPDPCPATFDGSFWSYWHSTEDGEWTSYLVGADSSDPLPGELEGWRYNDGSAGPGLTPGEVAESVPPAAPDPAADDVEPAPTAPATSDALLFGGVGIGALAVLAVALLLLRSRRGRSGGVARPGAGAGDDAG